MRHHDARDGEFGERGIDRALGIDVEMGCAPNLLKETAMIRRRGRR
jgi:hypothetical protein